MKPCKRSSPPRGQGMVEFALVIPILLALVVGIFEAGRALWIYSAVTSASRSAARFGSAAGESGGTLAYLDCNGIRQEAMTIGAPGNVQAADVTIGYDHGPGTSVFGSCPVAEDDIALGDRIVVTVIGHYTPTAIIPLLPLTTFDITSVTYRTILKEVPVGNTPAVDPSLAADGWAAPLASLQGLPGLPRQ